VLGIIIFTILVLLGVGCVAMSALLLTRESAQPYYTAPRNEASPQPFANTMYSTDIAKLVEEVREWRSAHERAANEILSAQPFLEDDEKIIVLQAEAFKRRQRSTERG